MVYEISGVTGKYDKYDIDKSLKYGMNAASNHKSLALSTMESTIGGEPPILDFSPSGKAIDANIEKLHGYIKDNDEYLKMLPPVDYQYRYMPKPQNGKIDKKSVLGAAYEEMGTDSMSVREFENKFLPGPDYTVKPLDLNNDGRIDVSEYGTSMLAADMLSKKEPDIKNIDGSINSIGMDAVMEYAKISNTDAAVKLYSKIHAIHNLNEIA